METRLPVHSMCWILPGTFYLDRERGGREGGRERGEEGKEERGEKGGRREGREKERGEKGEREKKEIKVCRNSYSECNTEGFLVELQ